MYVHISQRKQHIFVKLLLQKKNLLSPWDTLLQGKVSIVSCINIELTDPQYLNSFQTYAKLSTKFLLLIIWKHPVIRRNGKRLSIKLICDDSFPIATQLLMENTSVSYAHLIADQSFATTRVFILWYFSHLLITIIIFWLQKLNVKGEEATREFIGTPPFIQL